MNDLLQEARKQFQSLPIEKQRDLLWQYVLYVENIVINEAGDPFLFLKWYLLTEPFDSKVPSEGGPDA